MRKKYYIPLLILLDVLLVFFSLLMSLHLFYNLRPPMDAVRRMWRLAPILCTSTVAALWLTGTYRHIIRFANTEMIKGIALSTLVGTAAAYLISLLGYTVMKSHGIRNLILLSRSVYLIQWLLATIFILLSRTIAQLRPSLKGGEQPGKVKRVMVVGAGYGGAQVIHDIQNGRYGRAAAVIAVDDDPSKEHLKLSGVSVVSGTDNIPELCERYQIDEIIIAIATPRDNLAPLIDECLKTGCKVRMFSFARDVTGVNEAAGAPRDVNLSDLLGRPEQHLDMSEEMYGFQDRVVLITGGGGSIGSELCRQIMAFTPRKLIIYDISENYIYDLLFELKEKYGEIARNTVEIRVGSIRDRLSLESVFQTYRPEIVIHAAAHKHVPLMENDPEQAVLNNVFGTKNVVDCAVEYGARHFVLISTDKAVNPTNVMGATKRLAEMIVMSQTGKTLCSAVRFGNVLGSNGSVVPLFKRQIESGGPVTLTHPDIIRYFMSIPEAATLVLKAATIARGGEMFVLDMGEPVKIRDLAEKMIRLYGAGEDIKIVYTGLRPGEKLYEELLLDEETMTATDKEKIYIARPERFAQAEIDEKLSRLRACLDERGDMIQCLHEIVDNYHTPEEINRCAVGR